jgi:hypothetical protein
MQRHGKLAPAAWRKEIGGKLDASNVLLLRITEHAEACQGLLDRGYKKLLGRVPSVKLTNVRMKSDNKTLTATAKGTNDYDVEILLTLPTPSYCSCPFFAKANVPCKHILALATNWRGETERALNWMDGWLESLLIRVEYEG